MVQKPAQKGRALLSVPVAHLIGHCTENCFLGGSVGTAIKFDDLNWLPETHRVEGERKAISANRPRIATCTLECTHIK